MKRTIMDMRGGIAAFLCAASFLLVLVPAVAYAADEKPQTASSEWTEIICVVDKDSGGRALNESYGWGVIVKVTVVNGLLTDVETSARGVAMPDIPEFEKPYYTPYNVLMEEKIVDAQIAANNPGAIDDIDVVSKATSTCHWIKEATKKALIKWQSNTDAAAAVLDSIRFIESAEDKGVALRSAVAAYNSFKSTAADIDNYLGETAVNTLTTAKVDFVVASIDAIDTAADKKLAIDNAMAVRREFKDVSTLIPADKVQAIATAKVAYICGLIDAIEKADDKSAAIKAAREAMGVYSDVTADIPADVLKVLTTAEAEQDITKATVTLSSASVSYSGVQVKPAATVKSYTGATLKQGTDYTVTYGANTNAGKGTVTIKGIGGYTGTKTATFTIAPAANPMTVKAKSPSIKVGKSVVAKKAITVKNAQGKVSYKKTSGNAKIKVASNGKITVKKGCKKGTQKIKVKVTAKGGGNYLAGNKTVTVKIKVK